MKEISNGGELTVILNGNTIVPADVITDIATKDAVVTFKSNDNTSFVIDGDELSDKTTPIDLSIGASKTTISTTNFSKIGGTAKRQFTLGSIDIPAKMSITLDKADKGKFASLMKLNNDTGKYEYVSAAKIADDGTALVDIKGKSDCLLIVDSETKKPGDFNNDIYQRTGRCGASQEYRLRYHNERL